MLLAAAALSGCATFSNADVMATVDSTDISVDRFDTLATEYFERVDVFGTSAKYIDAVAKSGLVPAEIASFSHGTTVVTNIVPEHNGARAGTLRGTAAS